MTNSSSHVKTGRMPFWKDKFKGREGGKNLCVAIVILLTESVPEIPNLRSPLIPFFPILCLGATQGHCPFGPWKRLWLLASSIDPQRSVAVQFSSVQSLSHVRLFATPWIAACQASLSITNSWSLLKLMSIELVMPSNHLILCHPLLLPPSIFPSVRVFSNESVLRIRWPKYWSFSISPSSKHSGLISFRMNWMDLLAVQGTLKSLPQYHSSKASIIWHSAFFIVQLSHPYMTTGKTTALTRWTFVDKVMSLLFHMLSRLVITFLPRSKHLLISWLQSHLH